jgi:FdhD protein
MKNTLTYNAIRITNGDARHVEDALTLEHPLSISINGTPFTLTMQTPGNEYELTRGLLFTEGVYKRKSGQLSFEVKERSEQGFISKVDLRIGEEDLDQSQLNKRNLLSVASCGICGKTELEFPRDQQLENSTTLPAIQIQEMFAKMADAQSAFIRSGGCHAASIFDKDFSMLSVMEDIGRHNAVDKVIGDLLNSNSLNQAKFLLVSGRVSYEIVAKSFMAGIPFLLAVSAPSTLAVDFAKELGITLMGFCREDRATVYSNHERIF